MRLVVLFSVVVALAGCDEDEPLPPAPVSVPDNDGLTTGPAATTTAADTGATGGGSGAADSSGGLTAGADGSSGEPTGTGGMPADICETWANKWVECVDPTQDAEALTLGCQSLTSEALLEFGPECASAIGDLLECVVQLDCPTFDAYMGGHGVIPAECATQQTAQDTLCM